MGSWLVKSMSVGVIEVNFLRLREWIVFLQYFEIIKENKEEAKNALSYYN